jgi:hypothetical protein
LLDENPRQEGDLRYLRNLWVNDEDRIESSGTLSRRGSTHWFNASHLCGEPAFLQRQDGSVYRRLSDGIVTGLFRLDAPMVAKLKSVLVP